MFNLSARSRARLLGVHPDLVKIVERAIELSSTDFSVVEGVRTLAAQKRYFMLGKSKTMRSRHLPESNASRLSCAVDLAPWINGTISWEPHEFAPVAAAMKSAALELGVPLEWGGEIWPHFIDRPHFQLPWSSYP
jgi:peptidoglycan L-alanyl-D-glutamate endopeptidase CwlK